MRPSNAAILSDKDRDLQSRVVNYLVGHRMPALRKIEVEARGGTVVLRGRVDSFYQKQLCLNCCRRVAGVIKLVEDVAVTSASPQSAVA
jgi:osmotically-inducible protein OsmY